jgi:hypothetical protein
VLCLVGMASSMSAMPPDLLAGRPPARVVGAVFAAQCGSPALSDLRPGDPVERVRKAVTNRIRYSLDRIATEHDALGRHLANSVHTGTFCSYTPERPTTWEL